MLAKRTLKRVRKEKQVKCEPSSHEDRYSLPTGEIAKISDIADSIGITRQAVSQALKRGLKKFYHGVSKMDNTWTPFQIALVMAKMLHHDNSVKELKSFIGLLPKDLQEKIKEDATKRLPVLTTTGAN